MDRNDSQGDFAALPPPAAQVSIFAPNRPKTDGVRYSRKGRSAPFQMATGRILSRLGPTGPFDSATISARQCVAGLREKQAMRL